MKQGTAFLLLAIAVLTAMVGGTFLYRKAFEKQKNFYKISRLHIRCEKSASAFRITLDPYLNVYTSDTVLLKEDVQAHQSFEAISTISGISFHRKDQKWSEMTDRIVTSYYKLDAGTGKTERKILNVKDWIATFNKTPESTRLLSNILAFEAPSDSMTTMVRLTMTMSDGTVFTDSCAVK